VDESKGILFPEVEHGMLMCINRKEGELVSISDIICQTDSTVSVRSGTSTLYIINTCVHKSFGF